MPADAQVIVPPSPQEITIANLRREGEALREELLELRQGWDAAIAEADVRAKAAAAREYVRDDGAAIAKMRESLDQARWGFDTALADAVPELAIRLAAETSARLAQVRSGEEDWLASVIARRLDELRAASVVALRVGPSDLTAALVDQLRPLLAPGVALEADPDLQPGTAKIELRLGQIDIDPAKGLCKLLAMVDPDAGNA